MARQDTHLPLFGPGPLYVLLIALLSALGAALSRSGVVFVGVPQCLKIPFSIAGIVMIALGVALWCDAFFLSKIDSGILGGRLVTKGAYSIVRNPLYTAFTLVFSGSLLLLRDAWLLALPPLFFLIMARMLKRTEEVWLREKFGKEYEDYCKKVPRCLPWPQKWRRRKQ